MSAQSIPTTTDVLIVGAGPTGLALALTLQRSGVDYVLIDKLAKGQQTSRAAVIHAHTLEMLAETGVSDTLAANGLRLTKFSLRDRDQLLVRLSFDRLPSPFRHLLMIPQDVTEAVLAARLEELGGQVHREVPAIEIEPQPGNVKVWIEEDGVRRAVDAKFVVGADGMHSKVLACAGIDFEGGSNPHSFLLADVEMDWPLGRDEVMLFFSRAGPLVVAPLPNGLFRVVAAVKDAPEAATVEDVQAVFDASGPQRAPARVKAVAWASRFRIHHRLASTYRRGRLLIMGDAAHVHSPAGGQGMNTGIVDAVVLGKLLSKSLSQRKGSSLLDAYSRLRRPAARRVLNLAGALTRMAVTRGRFSRAIRNLRLRMIGCLPFVRRRLVMNLSGLSRKSLAEV